MEYKRQNLMNFDCFPYPTEDRKLNLILVTYVLLGLAFLCGYGGIYNVPIQKEFFFMELDPRLSFPKVDSQVSTSMLIFIAGVIPLIVILSLLGYFWKARKFDLKKLLPLFMFLFTTTYLSLIVTVFFTDLLKIVVGEPRPNFYHYCNYQYINSNITYYQSHATLNHEGDFGNCHGSSHENRDSRSSFPSGHASSCMTSSICIALLLYYCNIQTPLVYLPFILGFYVGITRIQDYYHNVYDVLAGWLLGCVAAGLVWISLHPTIQQMQEKLFQESEEDEVPLLSVTGDVELAHK